VSGARIVAMGGGDFSLSESGLDAYVLGMTVQGYDLTKYGKDLTVPKTWDDYAQVAEFFTQPDKQLYGTTVMAGVGADLTSTLRILGTNGPRQQRLASRLLSRHPATARRIRALGGASN